MKEQEFKAGQKVTYTRTNEAGIVKSVPELRPGFVFVVFSCGGDWANYRNYTGQLTHVSKLTPGWVKINQP
jgi:hypothetical protein